MTTTYRATIKWRSDGEFRSGRYSRAHDWAFDGGAVVRGSSSPHSVAVPMSDAAAVDPEEALIASVSSCHMLWFLSLAQVAGHDIVSYRDDAEGVLGRDARGKIAMTRITLRPTLAFAGPHPGAEAVEHLHDDAHEKCFIANSLLTEIVVEPEKS